MSMRRVVAACLLMAAQAAAADCWGSEIREISFGIGRNNTTLSLSEKDCRVSVDFYDPTSVSFGSLIIRRDCGNDQEIRLIERLIDYLAQEKKRLPEIREVSWAPLGPQASKALASQALKSERWRKHWRIEKDRHANGIAVDLIAESKVFSALAAVFGKYGMKLREESVEKVATATIPDLVARGYFPAAGDSADEQGLELPYEGLLWFALEKAGAED